MTATPTTPRPFLASLLRSAGIGVAAVELVFLTIWMGLTLGLIESVQPYLRPLRPVLLDSLPALIAGMALAAVVGGSAGLTVAAVRGVVARAGRSPD